MTIYKSAITIALASCVSFSAAAADLRGTIESEAVTGSDWSGFYIGAGVTYSEYSDTDARFGGFESTGEDFALAAHVGYNLQFSDIIVGAEVDYTRLDSTFSVLPPGFPIRDLRINNVASFRGRLGYDLGNFMPYVTAGAGYASTNIAGLDGYGWVAGLGLDYKIRENWIFGVQYVHHEYSDFGGAPIDAELDQGIARISARF